MNASFGKKVGRCLLFLAGLLILLVLLSLVFRPKGNAASDGIQYSNANGFLAEPEQTIDVVILGDSLADCAFVPQKIWTDYGYTVYIAGTGGQRSYHAVQFLRNVLRTQSPRLVMVEAYHLYSAYPKTEGYGYMLEEYLPIMRYHDRWKNLHLRDFYAPVRYDSLEYQKGYHFDNRINPADDSHYMEPSDGIETVARVCAEDVRTIRKMCDEAGAELVIVSVPSAQNWNYERHNGTALLAEELGVQYLDMNLLRQEIPINWQTETQDFGDHVNYDGALKVSAYIGAFLQKHGYAQDRRNNPEAEGWNWSVQYFLEVNNLPEDSLK